MNPKISMDSSTSDANKHTNIPGSPSGTFGLAVGAVLVVLLPQQLGQDELVLLVQLLSLLPAGTRRHLGSEVESPAQLRRRRVRAGAGLGKRTWSRWDRGQTQPQEATAAAAGTEERRRRWWQRRRVPPPRRAGPARTAKPARRRRGGRAVALASGWHRRKKP